MLTKLQTLYKNYKQESLNTSLKLQGMVIKKYVINAAYTISQGASSVLGIPFSLAAVAFISVGTVLAQIPVLFSTAFMVDKLQQKLQDIISDVEVEKLDPSNKK